MGHAPPEFPHWLAERLRATDLSQSEAARRIGVTFRTLNRWVNGQSEPKLSQLRPWLPFVERFSPPGG